MLTPSKKTKLFKAIKSYNKKYLSSKTFDLDESGTRLMVNSFLTDILGFIPIEEVKTEYLIRGTYADYVIQTKGIRQFLVEVKALSYDLLDKHLRQAINYGANEGIAWALLTNGRKFDFYKIIFNKPIESRKVFSIDITDTEKLKINVETLQYLHRDSIMSKGLNQLWNKSCALDPASLASLLFASTVNNFIKRTLQKKFKCKFTDPEIQDALHKLVNESFETKGIKPAKTRSKKKPIKKEIIPVSEEVEKVI